MSRSFNYFILLTVLLAASVNSVTKQECESFQSQKAKDRCWRVYEAENNEVVEEESWDFGFGDDDDGFWDDEEEENDEGGEEGGETAGEEGLGLQVSLLPANYTYDPLTGPILYVVPPPPPKIRTSFDLPLCNALPENVTRKEGENCEVINTKPEIRFRDTVFEKLLPQVWSDYQNRIVNEKELYGVFIEPFRFPRFETVVDNSGLYLNMQLMNITVHGLSSIYLDETLVTRSENLNDLDMKMIFKFDKLVINGTYTADGTFWFSKIDSEGEQNFSVVFDSVSLIPHIRLDTVHPRIICSSAGSAHLSEIEVPLKYEDLTIKFENLGSVYNTMFNMAAVYFISSKEQDMAEAFKGFIKNEVNSLLC